MYLGVRINSILLVVIGTVPSGLNALSRLTLLTISGNILSGMYIVIYGHIILYIGLPHKYLSQLVYVGVVI